MDLNRLALIKTLHEKTLAAASAEKAATFHLLECLHRIEKTRAHIELSYPTLFDYVHRALGYAESQAYERIAAMRLAFKIPAVAEQLKSGELTLTGVARISSHAKREGLKPEAVVELSSRVAGHSVRQLEKVLASEAKTAPPRREILKPTSATTSTLLLTVDSEFEALLKEARELEPDPSLSIAEVLKRALRSRVAAKKKAKGEIGATTGAATRLSTTTAATKTDALNRGVRTSGVVTENGQKTRNGGLSQRHHSKRAIQGKSHRYVSIGIRQVLWVRDTERCSWVSAVTGLRCNSRQSLQIDHVFPYRLGGPTTEDNLRYLCAVHNRYKGMGT